MSKQDGFTLLELLVVAAIIGILASISVMRYTMYLDRAQISACAVNMHTLWVGLCSYKTDHERFPYADGTAGDEPTPNSTVFGNGPAANGYWSGAPWSLLEEGYVTDRKTFFCPTLYKKHPDKISRLRYAYDYGPSDVGGNLGGDFDIEKDEPNAWVLRCLHGDPAESGFDKSRQIDFPHENSKKENVLYLNGVITLEKGGSLWVRELRSKN